MSHMSLPSSSPTRCPECGAEVAAGQGKCWLCQRSAVVTANPNPYASPAPTENIDWQFSIESLFLVTTLIAVCLGLILWSPGLGILFSLLVAPALIRTVVDAAQHKRGGSRLNVVGKIGSFLLSICVIVAVGIASCVAGATVCTAGAAVVGAGGVNESATVLVLGIGACATLASFVGLLWTTRPRV